MKKKDAELIQRTLDGDQSAFTALVEKYQKGVHALAWQKIGDFHIAQEITQDAFLRAYQKLGTLKNHNLFSGWLYVIATRLCCEWLRKKRLPMQSLETVDSKEVDKVAYTRYVEEQRETDINEIRRELVRDLLKKLPESERTVMTLHYLGEMTCESISEFLGVSPNTIRSRLSRARNRLKKEETMIKENLSSFQLPTQMTENIMKEISRLNPVTPSSSKPLVPLAVSAASAVLVLLLMGLGTQRLSNFQKPYNLNAQSERTIEISEAQLVIDTPAKPAVKNQVGHADLSGESNGVGQKPDDPLFAAANADETEVSKAKPQWVQTKGPEGGSVSGLFTTTRGDVYAGTRQGLYRLTDDGTAWKLINNIKGPSHNLLTPIPTWWPVVERQDTLYLATNTEILASIDRGETWDALCECPEGKPIGMVITDGIPGAQSDLTVYIASTDGIFRTDNFGKSWTPLPEGLKDKKITAIAAIENTIFAGTDKGLYRLNSDTWEQLPINPEDGQDETLDIAALIATENHLYVAAKLGWVIFADDRSYKVSAESTITTIIPPPDKELPSWIELSGNEGREIAWSLFHSTDRGNSWKSITPRHDSPDKIQLQYRRPSKKESPGNKLAEGTYAISEIVWAKMTNPMLKITASGEKVMVIDGENHFYSIDAGEAWTFSVDASKKISSATAAVLSNASTFFTSGIYGIHRSTDSGKSWHQFNTGLVNTDIQQLIVLNGILYANTETGFVYSIDGGESWTPFSSDTSNLIHIEEFNGELYASKGREDTSRFLRLTSEGNSFTDIPGVPVLKYVLGLTKSQNSYEWIEIRQNKTHKTEFLIAPRPRSLTVTDTAYYVNYQNQLFRWRIGTLNWYDTGIADIGGPFHIDLNSKFVIAENLWFAVSGKTVYVGKRNGHLMQSFDEGDTWNDVTANLPFSVERFNAITFAGNFVYVATDKGVVLSSNGTDWQTLTDAEGTPLVVDRFAVDGTTVYGESEQKIYQLDENTNMWLQVSPEIPYPVTSFDVDGNTIYVGTFGRGVLRFALDE
ncbi:MAG: sigma-70 family RNA polymerase sigma factor [Candidatus Poribacteria bacterium]|nr:sigma-70 family RNA polymerase sigma factor [Candidatus Poribacteria bacterium]MDE0317814.1 sigma-70 family RNA polymerase sigma factor [Candidatus Poribacteria bacterium]